MALNILIDLALVAIVLCGFYYGYDNGLVRMILKPVGRLLCVALSILLCHSFGCLLILPVIDKPIEGYVREFLLDRLGRLSIDEAEKNIPTLLRVAAATSGIITDVEPATVGEMIDLMSEHLAYPVAEIIATVMSFFILLVITRTLVSGISLVLEVILDIDALNMLDRVLGVASAGIFALLLAWGFSIGLDMLVHTDALSVVRDKYGFYGGPIYQLFVSLSPIELLLSF